MSFGVLAPAIAAKLAGPVIDFASKFKDDLEAGNSVKNSAKDAGIDVLASTAKKLSDYIPGSFGDKIKHKIDTVESLARRKYITQPIFRDTDGRPGGNVSLTRAGLEMLEKNNPRFAKYADLVRGSGITGQGKGLSGVAPDSRGAMEFERFSKPAKKPVPTPRPKKQAPPKPKPRTDKMVYNVEEVITDIRDYPPHYRDKPLPIPKSKSRSKPLPKPTISHSKAGAAAQLIAPTVYHEKAGASAEKRKAGRPRKHEKAKEPEGLKRSRHTGGGGVRRAIKRKRT